MAPAARTLECLSRSRKSARLVKPGTVGHIAEQKMLDADVIVYCILDDLHAPLVQAVNQIMIGGGATEPRIDGVMIGERIAVFGAVGHIV